MTKVCGHCKVEKSLSEFGKDKYTKSGLACYCKTCMQKHNHKNRQVHRESYIMICKEHARATKQKYVDYKGGKCSVCGYSKCLGALEFHHINPKEKDAEIGKRGVKQGKQVHVSALKELDKCICVCANCHREIHYFNGQIQATKSS